MEGIAAYADEGSNPSLNDEGSSDRDEGGRGTDDYPEQGDVMDAVDDNAEDGYREEDFRQAEYEDESKENEDYSEDQSRQHASPYGEYEDEEGELSMTSDTAPKASFQEVVNDEDNDSVEKESDRNGLEEEEEEVGERVLPQEVTTPFSLASFLSSVAPQISEEPSSQSKEDKDLEFAYVNGTYARVAKNKVDVDDLDRRLDDLRQQRREEIGLLKMYGLDDRGGGKDGRNNDSRDSRDRRDKDKDHEDSRRRSRSRSRDRDRERRRSRSRDRRRSRSRDRRRSRSRDRSSRRDRDSPDRSRGRDDKDRFGRDKDRFGRDRDEKDRFGRDKDRFGREKDRFGRDRRDQSREVDREDRKDNREYGRSRSPRNDRRDNNNRDRQFGGRGQEGNSQFRDVEKQRNDMQEQPMYGDQRGSEDLYPGRQDTSFSGGQDFYPSQQPPMQPPPLPVPPPESYPQSQFQGPQPGFNQPPPPLDPFSTSIPPPQPWMGPGFQQQVPPPPQQPPPPPHLLGSTGYSQPPPPLPASVNPMNNGDINTLKKNLSMLTGASDPNSGSPGMGGTQGYGTTVQDPSQPPHGGMGERFSGYGRDTGYSDSGIVNDDDPMDLDLPASAGGSDDYQGRVVEEVKNAIRPFFSNRQISKDEYKEILKKCVPKVASSGEINPKKISNLVGAYVKKMRGTRSK